MGTGGSRRSGTRDGGGGLTAGAEEGATQARRLVDMCSTTVQCVLCSVLVRDRPCVRRCHGRRGCRGRRRRGDVIDPRRPDGGGVCVCGERPGWARGDREGVRAASRRRARARRAPASAPASRASSGGRAESEGAAEAGEKIAGKDSPRSRANQRTPEPGFLYARVWHLIWRGGKGADI